MFMPYHEELTARKKGKILVSEKLKGFELLL